MNDFEAMFSIKGTNWSIINQLMGIKIEERTWSSDLKETITEEDTQNLRLTWEIKNCNINYLINECKLAIEEAERLRILKEEEERKEAELLRRNQFAVLTRIFASYETFEWIYTKQFGEDQKDDIKKL
jgi:hypothetical protein